MVSELIGLVYSHNLFLAIGFAWLIVLSVVVVQLNHKLRKVERPDAD